MNKNVLKNISILLICLLIIPAKNFSASYNIYNVPTNNQSNSELLNYISKVQPIYNELYYLGDSVYSALVKKQDTDNLIKQIDYEMANLNSLREDIFSYSNNPNISSNNQTLSLGVLITTGYYRLAYQSLRIALTTKNSNLSFKYLEDFFRYNTLGLTTLTSIEKNINL